MRFSVIIPCFNASDTIGATLDSVYDQTHPAIETIVIDDGSTDDSQEVVSNHKLKPRLLKSPRKGPAGARNVGLRASNGDAIAFIDADDIWRCEHLAIASQMLTDTPAVAGLSACDFLIDQDVLRSNRRYPLDSISTDLDHSDFLRFFLETELFCQPSAVFHRRVLGNGFDESLWGTEDIEFFMRAIYEKRWAYNPKSTVIYRLDSPSSVSKNIARQTLHVLLAHLKSNNLGYEGPLMQRLLRRAARRAAVGAIAYGDSDSIRTVTQLAGNYLGSPETVALFIAKLFPRLSRSLIRMRHQKLVITKRQRFSSNSSQGV